MSLFKTGLFTGKFMPPHRGHLMQIIEAATQCETLYVVVSAGDAVTQRLCDEGNLKFMDLKTRTMWLSQELYGLEHIKVLMLDESDIAEYPNGWADWSAKIRTLIPEKIDAIFGGDAEYKNGYEFFFPESKYILFDYSRSRYPVSATMIRKDPYKYWDYILGSARPFFAKKVLITGTESCGKTTLTKYLAKMFHTSWSEEVGRYYAGKYLGGNESVYSVQDFERIAYMQYEADMDALHKANKIVFYDTDALVTLYYMKLYMNVDKNPIIESFINPSRYDAILLCTPSVKWVDDGSRYNGEQARRESLHEELVKMYSDYNFKNNMFVVDGNYNDRLEQAYQISRLLIRENK